MAVPRWIPEMLRRRPSHVLTVHTDVGTLPLPASTARTVEDALRAFGATSVAVRENGWGVDLGWRTLVLGVVRREVDERVQLGVAPGTVHVRCRPEATHGAHAAGAAAVIAVSAATWLLTRQLASAATTLVGGLLLVDVTRELALSALERRLARLAQDVSMALWPGRPPTTATGRVSEPAGE